MRVLALQYAAGDALDLTLSLAMDKNEFLNLVDGVRVRLRAGPGAQRTPGIVNYPPMNGRACGSTSRWLRGGAACGRLTAPQPCTPRSAMLRAAL
jgi:hypothetical protein